MGQTQGTPRHRRGRRRGQRGRGGLEDGDDGEGGRGEGGRDTRARGGRKSSRDGEREHGDADRDEDRDGDRDGDGDGGAAEGEGEGEDGRARGAGGAQKRARRANGRGAANRVSPRRRLAAAAAKGKGGAGDEDEATSDEASPEDTDDEGGDFRHGNADGNERSRSRRRLRNARASLHSEASPSQRRPRRAVAAAAAAAARARLQEEEESDGEEDHLHDDDDDDDFFEVDAGGSDSGEGGENGDENDDDDDDDEEEDSEVDHVSGKIARATRQSRRNTSGLSSKSLSPSASRQSRSSGRNQRSDQKTNSTRRKLRSSATGFDVGPATRGLGKERVPQRVKKEASPGRHDRQRSSRTYSLKNILEVDQAGSISNRTERGTISSKRARAKAAPLPRKRRPWSRAEHEDEEELEQRGEDDIGDEEEASEEEERPVRITLAAARAVRASPPKSKIEAAKKPRRKHRGGVSLDSDSSDESSSSSSKSRSETSESDDEGEATKEHLGFCKQMSTETADKESELMTDGAVLFYGDSITWGMAHNYTGRYEKTWPRLLTKRLDQYNLKVVESALCSRTTALDDDGNGEWLTGAQPHDFNGLDHFVPEFISACPKWLVVLLGTNDLRTSIRKRVKARTRLDARQIAKSCARVPLAAREIHAKNPFFRSGLRIIVVCPPQVNLNALARELGYDDSSAHIAQDFSRAYKQMCEEHDFLYAEAPVDMSSSIDGIHVTEEANELYADAVWSIFHRELGPTPEEVELARVHAAAASGLLPELPGSLQLPLSQQQRQRQARAGGLGLDPLSNVGPAGSASHDEADLAGTRSLSVSSSSIPLAPRQRAKGSLNVPRKRANKKFEGAQAKKRRTNALYPPLRPSDPSTSSMKQQYSAKEELGTIAGVPKHDMNKRIDMEIMLVDNFSRICSVLSPADINDILATTSSAQGEPWSEVERILSKALAKVQTLAGAELAEQLSRVIGIAL